MRQYHDMYLPDGQVSIGGIASQRDSSVRQKWNTIDVGPALHATTHYKACSLASPLHTRSDSLTENTVSSEKPWLQT